MYMEIGKYEVTANLGARWPWSHLRLHRRDDGFHFVWGKFSFLVENWIIEKYEVCSECDSPDVYQAAAGDEGWTICPDCRTIEGKTYWVNKRQFEKLLG